METYDIAKRYYDICRQCKDKFAFFEDRTIALGLIEFLTNPQAKVVYVASKILLLLTESHDLCVAVTDVPGLTEQVSKATERILPPKILRNLMLAHSRIVAAGKVQTRTMLGSSDQSDKSRMSFIPTRESRNVVFKFERLNSGDKRAVETSLVKVKGVVSLYFDTPNLRVIIRAMNSLSPRYLSTCILNCTGFEFVKHVVKNESGGIEEHGYYAELIPTEETVELPQYLDDLDIDLFDNKQCIATKEQIASAASSSWFTTIRSIFW